MGLALCLDNMNHEDLIYRLRKRAEIRRQIGTRKSVQEGKPDRLADLLDEAAGAIEGYSTKTKDQEENQMTIDVNKVAELGSAAGQSVGYTGYSDLYNAALVELVVKECLQVLIDRDAPNVHGDHIGVNEIKQHFGML